MKVKLLIATDDTDYAEHLSNYIAEHYSDAITVTVCTMKERLKEVLRAQSFDIALFEPLMLKDADLGAIALPIALKTDESSEELVQTSQMIKYQRISSIVTSLFTKSAEISKYTIGADAKKANVTAVWSPVGGVGKTTVALAYAAQKVTEGKQVLYLNLETFSSVPAYFDESGKSISAVFEMLESSEGNIKMLIRGICQQDSGAGVAYFCRPENFDDMYALSADNIAQLTTVCASATQELVVDMSCLCDRKVRRVFDLSDRVLLVTDSTPTTQVKFSQFSSQNNVFENIKEKIIYVSNKGAGTLAGMSANSVQLPNVQSSDPKIVFKTLSQYFGQL